MAFAFEQASIPGLFLVQPKVFGDARGYFLETWSERDFATAGIKADFVQDNQSKSMKGVLRGLHFQKTHPQGKLIRVVSGSVFDVAVDLRGGSPTFGKWHAATLSAVSHNQFFIPPGFAHGFLTLEDDTVFIYKCTDFYHPEDEGGIIWDDPVLGIEWPDLGLPLSLSAKDAALPRFDPDGRYYSFEGGAL